MGMNQQHPGYQNNQRCRASIVCFVPTEGELAYPVHRAVLETMSRSRGSELPGTTMIPQMTVVADQINNAA